MCIFYPTGGWLSHTGGEEVWSASLCAKLQSGSGVPTQVPPERHRPVLLFTILGLSAPLAQEWTHCTPLHPALPDPCKHPISLHTFNQSTQVRTPLSCQWEKCLGRPNLAVLSCFLALPACTEYRWGLGVVDAYPGGLSRVPRWGRMNLGQKAWLLHVFEDQKLQLHLWGFFKIPHNWLDSQRSWVTDSGSCQT